MFSLYSVFLLVGTMGLNECLVCLHELFLPLITFSAYLLCLRPSSPHKTRNFFLFWPLRYNLLACIYSRPSHLSCDSFAAFLHHPNTFLLAGSYPSLGSTLGVSSTWTACQICMLPYLTTCTCELVNDYLSLSWSLFV